MGTCIRAVLNPDEPHFASLALILLMAVSSGTMITTLLVIVLIPSAHAKNPSLCRGLANATRVSPGSRRPKSLTSCNLATRSTPDINMFRHFHLSEQIQCRVHHRSFSLFRLHKELRGPMDDDIAISTQCDVARFLQAIQLPAHPVQGQLCIPQHCVYVRVFRCRFSYLCHFLCSYVYAPPLLFMDPLFSPFVLLRICSPSLPLFPPPR